MTSKLNIVCLYDKSGCCYWRSYKPLLAMQKNGLANITFLELKNTSKKQMLEASSKADIIQAMGLMGTEGLTAVRQYKSLGVKLVIDYDDLYFNCSPLNPAFRRFGLEDIEVKDPITDKIISLWKDGRDGYDIKRNKFQFMGYKKILQEADLITTTTLYLKDAILEVSEGKANVAVLPNAIDFDLWKPLDVREKFKDKFRFGWAVSGSHGEDWTFIHNALLTFLKSHPDAKFVCIGDTYMDVQKGLEEVKDQIEWYPFSDLWEGHYQLRMPLLGLDCAIAPLNDSEFNRCKSPLKWEEYTAFGWPVIAQNMSPYKEHIEHGRTGLLAGTKEEWVAALDKLYNDEKLRRQLRFNALMEVKETFDINVIAKEYAEIYENLVNREVTSAGNQLNA